jgi:hypothetical protein
VELLPPSPDGSVDASQIVNVILRQSLKPCALDSDSLCYLIFCSQLGFIAGPGVRDIGRHDLEIRPAEQPVHWLASDFSDRVPYCLFDSAPLEQAPFQELLNLKEILPDQQFTNLGQRILRCAHKGVATDAAARVNLCNCESISDAGLSVGRGNRYFDIKMSTARI